MFKKLKNWYMGDFSEDEKREIYEHLKNQSVNIEIDHTDDEMDYYGGMDI